MIKKIFAVVIVVLLALGMIGMFMPALLANNTAPSPAAAPATQTQ